MGPGGKVPMMSDQASESVPLPKRFPWVCVDCGKPWPGRQFQATPFEEDRCECGGTLDGGWKDPEEYLTHPGTGRILST